MTRPFLAIVVALAPALLAAADPPGDVVPCPGVHAGVGDGSGAPDLVEASGDVVELGHVGALLAAVRPTVGRARRGGEAVPRRRRAVRSRRPGRRCGTVPRGEPDPALRRGPGSGHLHHPGSRSGTEPIHPTDDRRCHAGDAGAGSHAHGRRGRDRHVAGTRAASLGRDRARRGRVRPPRRRPAHGAASLAGRDGPPGSARGRRGHRAVGARLALVPWFAGSFVVLAATAYLVLRRRNPR